MVLWLLMAVTLTGCATKRKTLAPAERTRLKDSTAVRDSVVLKDSTVMMYGAWLKDAAAVKDSVVMTVDSSGRIISREHYRDTWHDRTAGSLNSLTALRQTNAHGSILTARDSTMNHWAHEDKAPQTSDSRKWLAATLIVLLLAVCAAVSYRIQRK